MSIRYQYCHAYGFDREKIKERLKLFQLNKNDFETAKLLQEIVVQPNSRRIISKFYTYLSNNKQYRLYLPSDKIIESLKNTQLHYLTTLGDNFGSESYFDDRIRVGVAHSKIGMPLSLYECAYHHLRELILECVPSEFEDKIVNDLRSFVLKIISLDMSLAIDSYMNTNSRQLENNIVQLVKKNKKFQYWSEIDHLTHVSNRSAILKNIRLSMLEATKKHIPLSIVMIDFDRLSVINDEYGHMVGDLLLKSVIEAIKPLLSNVDKLGRYGGDEFIIVLPGKDNTNAQESANHIQSIIHKKIFKIGDHELEIHFSFGVATYVENDTLSDFFKHVDNSLLESKASRGE